MVTASPPTALSSPLGLRERLKTPSRRLNPVVLLDVFLVALFFSLLGSQLLMPPGVTVDLPRVSADQMSALPTDASLSLGAMDALGVSEDAFSSLAVLSLRSARLILFNGEILSIDQLSNRMDGFVNQIPEGRVAPVLHLKVGADVPFQVVLDVCAMAQAAGFAKVHFAARPTAAEPAGFLPLNRP
ncbi:MAG: ExbD/TolR family protein [Opitutales bacterium]